MSLAQQLVPFSILNSRSSLARHSAAQLALPQIAKWPWSPRSKSRSILQMKRLSRWPRSLPRDSPLTPRVALDLAALPNYANRQCALYITRTTPITTRSPIVGTGFRPLRQRLAHNTVSCASPSAVSRFSDPAVASTGVAGTLPPRHAAEQHQAQRSPLYSGTNGSTPRPRPPADP